MRSLIVNFIAIPIALLGYIVSVIVFCSFFYWFFDKPQNWSYFIPITTSMLSAVTAMGIAEEISDNKKVVAAVTLTLIGIFWIGFVLVDIGGSISDIIALMMGKNVDYDEMDMIISFVDEILSGKIFAVVTCLAAAGSWGDAGK